MINMIIAFPTILKFSLIHFFLYFLDESAIEPNVNHVEKSKTNNENRTIISTASISSNNGFGGDLNDNIRDQLNRMESKYNKYLNFYFFCVYHYLCSLDYFRETRLYRG